MHTAHVVKFETPKGVPLNGLWFGSKKPKQVIIFVHGMTGNVFSMNGVVTALAKRQTAVLTFNNRGHDIVSTFKRRKGVAYEYGVAGTAQEVFTDSADDIQGALSYVRSIGVRDVYIAGHSTGAQKTVYWISKTKDKRGVRGLILLGPLSDYAEARVLNARRQVKGVAVARALIKKGTPHAMMPIIYTPDFPLDAQRFLSLNTANSIEEVFTYGQPGVVPKKLRGIETPMLVLLAEKDEYGSWPASELASWFTEYIYTGEAIVIRDTNHGFKDAESVVARTVDSFMKERYN